jgi:hypothetical protein
LSDDQTSLQVGGWTIELRLSEGQPDEKKFGKPTLGSLRRLDGAHPPVFLQQPIVWGAHYTVYEGPHGPEPPARQGSVMIGDHARSAANVPPADVFTLSNSLAKRNNASIAAVAAGARGSHHVPHARWQRTFNWAWTLRTRCPGTVLLCKYAHEWEEADAYHMPCWRCCAWAQEGYCILGMPFASPP